MLSLSLYWGHAMFVEPDKVESIFFYSEPSLPMLQIPSSKFKHNLVAESDDEVDEIGAWIYVQVMQRRQFPVK